MTRMKNGKGKPPGPTPEQTDEDKDLVQFSHDAAVRVFQMLDEEEAKAGLSNPYSPRRTRKRRIKMNSVKSAVRKGMGK